MIYSSLGYRADAHITFVVGVKTGEAAVAQGHNNGATFESGNLVAGTASLAATPCAHCGANTDSICWYRSLLHPLQETGGAQTEDSHFRDRCSRQPSLPTADPDCLCRISSPLVCCRAVGGPVMGE